MRLTCFRVTQDALRIVPASASRDWMDRFPDRHAYRCLPLSIANAHGWHILNRSRFTAIWDGRTEQAGIAFSDYEGPAAAAKSHFSFGVITFELGVLFRTEPGWNMMVTGPINQFKDGIAPMGAIVETDWLPYTFTMNWRFTRALHPVTFEKDEPICQIMLVPKNAVLDADPVYDSLDNHPDLREQMAGWRERRDEFMARFNKRDPSAFSEKWQKLYFRGTLPDGTGIADHVNKLRVQPFRELTADEIKADKAKEE